MSLTLRLLASALGGLAMHRFYRPSQALGVRWGSLLRYAIGTIAMLPFVLMVVHAMRAIESEDERITAAYLLTAGGFGTGTFVGHLMDRMENL